MAGHVPWYVYFLVDQNKKCGGALINKVWILSAAHCFCGIHLPCKRVDVDGVMRLTPTYNVSDFLEVQVVISILPVIQYILSYSTVQYSTSCHTVQYNTVQYIMSYIKYRVF